MNKQQITSALRAFIGQRSGIDPRLYRGDSEAFLGDYRPILRAGADARSILRYIELRDSITVDDILSAAGHRLTITERNGSAVVDYCAGQYFAVEYRPAACRVLAGAIWKCLERNQKAGDDICVRIRKAAACELGKGLAQRWFN